MRCGNPGRLSGQAQAAGCEPGLGQCRKNAIIIVLYHLNTGRPHLARRSRPKAIGLRLIMKRSAWLVLVCLGLGAAGGVWMVEYGSQWRVWPEAAAQSPVPKYVDTAQIRAIQMGIG